MKMSSTPARMTIPIRFKKILSDAIVPRFAHGSDEDAGMDLFAAENAELEPGQWQSVRTGLSIEIPSGYEGQIRPRSGLAKKHGITLLNSPGTIDPGYRGEVHVILINFGPEPYSIKAGNRIAQLIISNYQKVEWEPVEDLQASGRGSKGFGSTGR